MTGSVSGKYGPIAQSHRPVTYLITIALTTLASVIWSVFAVVLGVLAARWREGGPR